MNVGLNDEALQRYGENTEEGENWTQAAETQCGRGPAPGKNPFRSPFRAAKHSHHGGLFWYAPGLALPAKSVLLSMRIHRAHSGVTLPSGYEIVRQAG